MTQVQIHSQILLLTGYLLQEPILTDVPSIYMLDSMGHYSREALLADINGDPVFAVPVESRFPAKIMKLIIFNLCCLTMADYIIYFTCHLTYNKIFY